MIGLTLSNILNTFFSIKNAFLNNSSFKSDRSVTTEMVVGYMKYTVAPVRKKFYSVECNVHTKIHVLNVG